MHGTYVDETAEDADYYLEHQCLVGFLPDMRLVDDPEIASHIGEGLVVALECPDTLWDDVVYCVEQRYTFHLRKKPDIHRWSRVAHCVQCMERTDRDERPCNNPFLIPRVITTRGEPPYPTCIKKVVYIGLAG